jgi:hypothetical protein
MQKMRIRLIAGALLATALSGCTQTLQPPIEFQGIQLRRVSPDLQNRRLTLDVDLKFHVRNYLEGAAIPLQAPFLQIGTKLSIGDPPTLTAVSQTPSPPNPTSIAPNGEADLLFPQTLVINDIFNAGNHLIGTDVPYVMAGNFTFAPPAPFPSRTATLRVGGKIRVPRPPEVQLTSISPPEFPGAEIPYADYMPIDLHPFTGIKAVLEAALRTFLSGIDTDPNRAGIQPPPDPLANSAFGQMWNCLFDRNDPGCPALVNPAAVRRALLRFTLRISNPNTFEINVPTLAMHLKMSGATVASITAQPNDLTPIRGRTGNVVHSRDVPYECSIQVPGGPWSPNPSSFAFDSLIKVDFGYGLMELPLKFPM